MKTKSTLALWLMLLTTTLFWSCRTAQTSMEVLTPAEISVPSHIQSVAVANRSLPGTRADRILNVLEGLVTGEPLFADREGSNHCVNGLIVNLNEGPRFTAVLATDERLFGTGTRQFPPALSWSQVDSICKKYGVDALILLETFDSNSKESEGSREVKRRRDGREYIEKVFVAEVCIDVNAGWRIYDNVNRRIIDQNVYLDGRCWTGEGQNIEAARRRLPSRRRAINDAGAFAGHQYALRISPNWVRVNRTFFIGGHDGFKEARQHVRYNNWEAAVKIWENLSRSNDRKIAGRAVFNLAVAAEVRGELDEAIRLVTRAKREYHVREARGYLTALQRRKMDEQRLDQQMRSPEE